MARARDEPAPGTEGMRIVNQLWWLSGILMAAPLLVPGTEHLVAGSYWWGGLFVTLGFFVLFVPEYIRWRWLGGSSPFERVPLIGTRANRAEE